jgi:hypothetical protein
MRSLYKCVYFQHSGTSRSNSSSWLLLEGRSGLANAVLLQRLLLLGVHQHRRPGMQLLHPTPHIQT